MRAMTVRMARIKRKRERGRERERERESVLRNWRVIQKKEMKGLIK